ncbi:FliM/FliN family flagellar motor switch protein [Acanthopleuribacter pedis]|uniref:FliM/FliN family flagellar motor switch protein n=1 Tax=Acanthopleuribacter pedis TaxID=442870 RepID=A0A8J7QRN1_9BACT|nr:FliM/FliN family flagellar motor switch protein [Acanthopleuribacter pedis]MBO1322975.1 FliM/FliN family flagellar motor switch protein [Acanthopleuribacter pedis]
MSFSRFIPSRLNRPTVSLQNRLYALSGSLVVPIGDDAAEVTFPVGKTPTCTLELDIALAEHRVTLLLENGPALARLTAEMQSAEWDIAGNDIRAMLVETWFEHLFFQFEQITGLPVRCLRVAMEPSGLAPFLAFQQCFELRVPGQQHPLLRGVVGFNESEPVWFAELLEAMPQQPRRRAADIPFMGSIHVTRITWRADQSPNLARGDVLFPERLDRPSWRRGDQIHLALNQQDDVWTVAEPPCFHPQPVPSEDGIAIDVEAGEVAVTLQALTEMQVGDTLSRPAASRALQLRRDGVLIGRAVPVAVFGQVGLRVEEVFPDGNAEPK